MILDIADDPEVVSSLEKRFHIGSLAYCGYKHETSSAISTYASLGAKNYSYECVDGEKVVKSRGFSLRAVAASQKINHDVMKELLKSYLRGEISSVKCPAFTMVVNRKNATVKNRTIDKTYSNNVFDKRVVLPNTSTACTLPFGLKHYEFIDCDKNNVFLNGFQ